MINYYGINRDTSLHKNDTDPRQDCLRTMSHTSTWNKSAFFIYNFNMGYKFIEIEEGKSLSLYLDNLVVEWENNKMTIPLCDIDSIISHNIKLRITAQLINAFAKHNINFIICDANHIPVSQIIPLYSHFNTLKIFQEQLSWTNNYKNFLWVKIIRQKITNQMNVLKFFKNDESMILKLSNLINEVKEFDMSNREGHAAKVYWHSLFGIKFNRNEDSIINSLLNYGYALIYSMLSRSIVKKGLDPRVSLFHKSFNNTFALATDFMEIFRFVIDIKVFTLFLNNQMNNFYLAKEEIISWVANYSLIIDGKKMFINNAVDYFIDCVIKGINFKEIEIIWDQNIDQCD